MNACAPPAEAGSRLGAHASARRGGFRRSGPLRGHTGLVPLGEEAHARPATPAFVSRRRHSRHTAVLRGPSLVPTLAGTASAKHPPRVLRDRIRRRTTFTHPLPRRLWTFGTGFRRRVDTEPPGGRLRGNRQDTAPADVGFFRYRPLKKSSLRHQDASGRRPSTSEDGADYEARPVCGDNNFVVPGGGRVDHTDGFGCSLRALA